MNKYTDLHIHTKYTENNGITEIPELIAKAKEYNMDSIAIVDSGNLSGISEFYIEANKNNIKAIIGLGFYFAKDSRFSESDEKYHLVLLAQNYEGFQNLIQLAKLSFTEGFYKRPRIDFDLLDKYNSGLVCLTGGLGGLIDKMILSNKKTKALEYINKFIDIFSKDRFYLELQDNEVENNKITAKALISISKEKNINLVVSGGSFYLKREDYKKCNKLRTKNGNRELKGSGYYFRSSEEIYSLFPDNTEAIENSYKLSKNMNLNLDISKLKKIDYKNNSDLENILELEKFFI